MRPTPGRRTAVAAVGVLLAVPVSGCTGDGVPDRAPDVTGVVATSSEPAGGAVLVAASDDYYEGMSLLPGDPDVVDAGGKRLEPSDLRAGNEVEVWVGGPCAESYPVQCDIATVRVLP